MKGILMKPDLIKAVVDLRKTVMRRAMNPQPIVSVFDVKEHSQAKGYFIPYAKDRRMVNNNIGDHKNDCGCFPRYQVGDVVYIKEAYYCPVSVWVEDHYEPDGRTFYKLDNPSLFSGYWKSPLFMPAWAARRFIEITGVRAEKLNTITDEDVKAEGTPDVLNNIWPTIADYHPQQAYCHLWNTINKPPHDWESNPWVWRYEFKLVAQPEGI